MKSLMGAVFAIGVAAAGQASAQEVLNVWWVKGFYKSEDDALFEAIKKFEEKTGIKVELSQYAIQDMIPKTVAALDSGTPPDVAYADTYDFQVAGKWAFEGKLEDLTDIIEPMKGRFAPQHGRDDLPLQRQDQEEGLLRLPAQAADACISRSGATCWSRPASRKPTFRRTGRTTGRSGATRCSRPTARRPAQRGLRHRPADGRGIRPTRF